jgi:lactoylglutathione lyase
MNMPLRAVGAITLFVEDLARAKAFYQLLTGADAMFEDADSAAFGFDNTIINLLAANAAHDLIAPATVASANQGTRCQYTIWVDDADAACAHLGSLGIALVNGPLDRP